jgi:MFS transporter, DHA3 family, macrolide efflux protein
MLLPRSTTFRRLWLGQTISVVGDGMQRVALLWWASSHGGTTTVTALALTATVPTLLCSAYGGVWADRRDRFRLLLGSEWVRALCSVLLSWLIVASVASTFSIIALVAISAIATAVFDPAYEALIPDVVTETELPKANGVDLAKGAGGGLIGPIVGGIVLSAWSLGVVCLANAISFATSIVFIYSAHISYKPTSYKPTSYKPTSYKPTSYKPASYKPTSHRRTPASECGISARVRSGGNNALSGRMANKRPNNIRETMQLIRSIPELPRLIALPAMLNGAVGPISVLLVALATDQLHLRPAEFGALQSLLGLGLLIGALASPRLVRGRVVVPLTTTALAFAVTSVASAFVVAATLFVAGFAIAVANTELATTFQVATPNHARGRIFGMADAISHALRPIGVLLAAPLLNAVGVHRSFLVVAAAVLIPTCIWGRGDLLPITPPPSSDVG